MTAAHRCACGSPIFGESECSLCRVEAYLARKRYLRVGEVIRVLERATEQVRREKAIYRLYRETGRRRFCMSVDDDGLPCPDFAVYAGLCRTHRPAPVE